jgi:hypothetical protein
MGLFSNLFTSKTSVEKETKDADKQLRRLKNSLEKDEKLFSMTKNNRHADGTSYTKQDCVAYAFMYSVWKQYVRDGVEFDINTAKWLLDTYCGGSDSYNKLFLLQFMMACSNESKQ